MSELRDLYQEIILHHYRSPRNFGALEGANRKAEGFNPLCGDHLWVEARVEGGRIQELRFRGSGCAISTAAASVMTEAVKGRTEEEADTLFRGFHMLVTGSAGGSGAAWPEPPAADLGKLSVFAGVREFPVRVKCATLCWHTLRAALRRATVPVSTE